MSRIPRPWSSTRSPGVLAGGATRRYVPASNAGAGFTQCDFIHTSMDVAAQWALYSLYQSGPEGRDPALQMLSAVRLGAIQGIYKEDTQAPALFARSQGGGWWQLVPQGQDAVVVQSSPSMVVFRRGVANDRARLGQALRQAWLAARMPRVSAPVASGNVCPMRPAQPQYYQVKSGACNPTSLFGGISQCAAAKDNCMSDCRWDNIPPAIIGCVTNPTIPGCLGSVASSGWSGYRCWKRCVEGQDTCLGQAKQNSRCT